MPPRMKMDHPRVTLCPNCKGLATYSDCFNRYNCDQCNHTWTPAEEDPRDKQISEIVGALRLVLRELFYLGIGDASTKEIAKKIDEIEAGQGREDT